MDLRVLPLRCIARGIPGSCTSKFKHHTIKHIRKYTQKSHNKQSTKRHRKTDLVVEERSDVVLQQIGRLLQDVLGRALGLLPFELEVDFHCKKQKTPRDKRYISICKTKSNTERATGREKWARRNDKSTDIREFVGQVVTGSHTATERNRRSHGRRRDRQRGQQKPLRPRKLCKCTQHKQKHIQIQVSFTVSSYPRPQTTTMNRKTIIDANKNVLGLRPRILQSVSEMRLKMSWILLGVSIFLRSEPSIAGICTPSPYSMLILICCVASM